MAPRAESQFKCNVTRLADAVCLLADSQRRQHVDDYQGAARVSQPKPSLWANPLLALVRVHQARPVNRPGR
jgi:hypothetical protein